MHTTLGLRNLGWAALVVVLGSGCGRTVSVVGDTRGGGAGGSSATSNCYDPCDCGQCDASTTVTVGSTTVGSSTVGTTVGSGPAPTCAPAPAPASSCPTTVVPDPTVSQADAQVALVGRWYVCGSQGSLIEEFGGKGIDLFPDGTFRLMTEANGILSCAQGFGVQGTWSLTNDAGIGEPDQYQLNFDWTGNGGSATFTTFANNRTFLRLENGGGGHDDMVKF